MKLKLSKYIPRMTMDKNKVPKGATVKTITGKKKEKPQLYEGRGEEFKYWHRYINRQKEHVRGPEVKRFLIGYQKTTHHDWYYDEHLPNTSRAEQNQEYGKMPLVKPIKDWFIFIGDRVEIMVGRDKGKIGEVCEIIRERNWCFVEGLHVENKPTLLREKDHLESQKMFYPQEMPLLITHEVKLVDPSDSKATDVLWRYTEDGTRVRVSARTGRIIPTPMKHKMTWEDHVYNPKPGEKDTVDSDLRRNTYTPKLCSFEQDVIESLGQKYIPRKKKGYWY